jgi:serine/threonine protein kinase
MSLTTMPHIHNELSEFDSITALLPAFEFEGLIARGAAGAVYKARQRSLDRDVAIRIIPREQGEDPAFRSSFRAGVKAMANITHPSVIRVFDSGHVGGLHYLVMEYVPGKSLHHSAHGKAIDPRQAAQIVIAACQGLAHAHGNGIVHRAIKPTDILLTPGCEPKIGNFGFARHSQADASGYMAPELADGSVPENPQSDVYAIGVVLRELLTGIPAGTVEAARTIVPNQRLAAICDKATHPDPAHRYPDATAFAEALKRWQASGTLLPAARPRQASPHRPRPAVVSCPTLRPGRVLLKNCAIIGFLLLAIQGTWGIYQKKQDDLARLQQVEDAKPRIIIVKAEPEKETPHQMEPMMAQMEP